MWLQFLQKIRALENTNIGRIDGSIDAILLQKPHGLRSMMPRDGYNKTTSPLEAPGPNDGITIRRQGKYHTIFRKVDFPIKIFLCVPKK